ncbi:hypothetical protein CDL15_Pgr006180 [Punica granatum]|uniref:Uncharacterized protein n=1 Tax=Punica granatum TaxID=22663 RepID=A0A218VUM6_PUNGR|nr:hypothetical protein CDL15_Pgr006180 [Punica granatum]
MNNRPIGERATAPSGATSNHLISKSPSGETGAFLASNLFSGETSCQQEQQTINPATGSAPNGSNTQPPQGQSIDEVTSLRQQRQSTADQHLWDSISPVHSVRTTVHMTNEELCSSLQYRLSTIIFASYWGILGENSDRTILAKDKLQFQWSHATDIYR